MRSIIISALACVATALLAPSQLHAASGVADLEAAFRQPPAAARPQVWWHWMNGNVSRPGITKDLKAIKQVGLGGVTLFEESDRIAEGPVRYASDEHLALIRFAADECQRLGLEFAFHNCPGWSSSGGPWITPEQAMKHVTWSETSVRGPGRVAVRLPAPPTEVNPNELPAYRYKHYPFYRDVAVIAFRTPARPDVRLDDAPAKAGFVARYGLREQTRDVPAGATIERDSIRVLPAVSDPGGELAWDAPPGEWTLLRVGYALTGVHNQQPPTTGRGLDCDKLSRAALDYHWEHFVGRVIAAARASGSRALTTVAIDSYEAETQTWTPRMPEEFRRLRGYDLLPFLPCLTGRIVESVETTERFLWDFRRTIADLVAENYYGHFAARCRAEGLRAAFEGYSYHGIFDDFEVSRLADVPMAEFWAGIFKYSHWSAKVAASAADLGGRHIVAAEAFTAGGADAAWRWHPYLLKAEGDHYLARGVTRLHFQASAHQPFGDDARPGMTMGPHGIQMNRHNTWWPQSRGWLDYLARTQAMLQQGQLVADVLYYYGDNAPTTLRTKPYSAKNPRGIEWSADNDTAPDLWTDLPAGHDFHVCSEKIIAELAVNERGQLTHPSGARYELLLLPDDTRMFPATLRQLAALVEAGATIVGPRPQRTPGLQFRGAGDTTVRDLAERMWGPAGPAQAAPHSFGRGQIVSAGALSEVLRARGVAPDFEYHSRRAGDAKPPRLEYQHRRVAGADFYFVSNQRNEPAAVRAVFRMSGRAPQLWQAETGERAPALRWHATDDGRSAVDLELGPAEACFVVFPDAATPARAGIARLEREGVEVTDPATARLVADAGRVELRAFAPGAYRLGEAAGRSRTLDVAPPPAPLDCSRDWSVTFPKIEAPQRFAQLASWTESAADSIRHFSGTATYTRTVQIDSAQLARDTVAELDLGDVQVVAELRVNDRDFGVLWKPPFRRDITAALRPGANTLTVRVTNLWRNRLIGDARIAGHDNEARRREMMGAAAVYAIPAWVRAGQPNPDARLSTFTTFPYLLASDPLSPSGLLGPVRLIFGRRLSLP